MRCQCYLTGGWINNFYNSSDLKKICNLLQIYCKIHYIKDDCLKNEIKTKDIDVPKNEAKYQLEIGYYKDHYFIYEKTKYSRYFIEYFDELKDVKDTKKIVRRT